MAQIYKKQGSWAFRVYYKDDQGKRKSINKQGFKLKSDAQDAARELEIKNSQIGLTDSETITFSDYFDNWAVTYRSVGVSPSTQNKYKCASDHIKKYFKKELLKNIKRADYQQFINDYGKNHVHESVLRLNGYIRASLLDAIEDRLITRDFTQRIKLGGSTKKRNDHNYLSLADAKALENYALATSSMMNVSRCEIYFALLSGARFGEISALKWDNINFQKNTIEINSSYSFDKRVGLKETKTTSSNRTIDVPKKLITFLKRLQIQQHEIFLKQGYKNENDYVFLSIRHEKISPHSVSKSLERALKEIKSTNKISFHGLRHTYASMLISNDISIQYISKQLGHSNISITMNTYLHLLEEKQKTESAKSMKILESF